MNIAELNQQLIDIRERLALRDRLRRDLEAAQRSLKKEQQELAELTRRFHKEDTDVRRLEENSLVSLLYSIIGDKEARLDQERQEYLAAKLKYDNRQRGVASLERDLERLRARLDALGPGLDQRYADLLESKQQVLLEQGGPAAERLTDLAEEQALAHSAEREVNEAIQAGEAAESGLRQAVDALESAQSWGTWDLLGGGIISSAIKQSRLDEAHEAVQAVQPLLQRFERELSDVDSAAGLSIESGGLTAFVDIFMDSLLFDLLVQSRINELLDAARGMVGRIEELLRRLEQQRESARQRLQSIEAERRQKIEQV